MSQPTLIVEFFRQRARLAQDLAKALQFEATQHLTAATILYREMDMRFWLEKAQVEGSGLP